MDLVALAVLAELIHFQADLQLWVAGRVVIGFAAVRALHAGNRLLRHIDIGERNQDGGQSIRSCGAGDRI